MIKRLEIECPQCHSEHIFTGNVDSVLDQITEPEGFHNEWCQADSCGSQVHRIE